MEHCGDSDHSPIMLELANGGGKPPSPFKFNRDWLTLEDFRKLVKDLWTPYSPVRHGAVAIHFVWNLGRIKQATKRWAFTKRENDARDLAIIEKELGNMMRDPVSAFSSEEKRDALVLLEKRKQVILKEQEEAWRLKSRAIWLKCGDENTKCFQVYE